MWAHSKRCIAVVSRSICVVAGDKKRLHTSKTRNCSKKKQVILLTNQNVIICFVGLLKVVNVIAYMIRVYHIAKYSFYVSTFAQLCFALRHKYIDTSNLLHAHVTESERIVFVLPIVQRNSAEQRKKNNIQNCTKSAYHVAV